ncbi:MAG: bifunctional 5,10-methylenetetrahydrofolate dehydrogenase/5,10-methenyltetrahydrofolate cyclohydrolase [Patescibacteria group bacterium]
MQIIDGKKLRDEILSKIKTKVASLPFQPFFCDILIGNDPASVQYVQMKMRKAEAVGMRFYKASFPDSISTEELIKEIEKINKIPNMCGVIVQLPLPKSIDSRKVLDAIDPRLDVDCLGTTAGKEFYNGNISLGFPAAFSCMALLDSIKLDLKDPRHGGASKKIVVLGNGELVGRPVTALLNFRGFSPIVITSETENKEEIIKNADILISGMGVGKYITGDMIKKGAVLIDAGASEANAGIIGDVDLESVSSVAGFVSPVPGGVGPVTVAMLLNNVLKVAQKLSPTPGIGER